MRVDVKQNWKAELVGERKVEVDNIHIPEYYPLGKRVLSSIGLYNLTDDDKMGGDFTGRVRMLPVSIRFSEEFPIGETVESIEIDSGFLIGAFSCGKNEDGTHKVQYSVFRSK